MAKDHDRQGTEGSKGPESGKTASMPSQSASVARAANAEARKANREDLRQLLVDIADKAAHSRDPRAFDPDSANAVPALFKLLCPEEFEYCKAGETTKRKKIRRPIAILSWHEGKQRWALTITDKVFGVQVTVYALQLRDLIEQCESCLLSGEAEIKTSKDGLSLDGLAVS